MVSQNLQETLYNKKIYTFIGDSTLARTELKWKPKVSFKELVKIMVNADMYRKGPMNVSTGPL